MGLKIPSGQCCCWHAVRKCGSLCCTLCCTWCKCNGDTMFRSTKAGDHTPHLPSISCTMVEPSMTSISSYSFLEAIFFLSQVHP